MKPEALQAQLKSSLTMFEWDSAANKVCWAMCKSIASEVNATQKLAVNEAIASNEAKAKAEGAEYPDDFVVFTPEQRAEEVAKLLDYKLKTKELTASELRELKDIFNLKVKDQDIHIEQVDFRAIEPELADVVAAVDWQIVEYNKGEG